MALLAVHLFSFGNTKTIGLHETCDITTCEVTSIGKLATDQSVLRMQDNGTRVKRQFPNAEYIHMYSIIT